MVDPYDLSRERRVSIKSITNNKHKRTIEVHVSMCSLLMMFIST